jgi:hypothetical protein
MRRGSLGRGTIGLVDAVRAPCSPPGGKCEDVLYQTWGPLPKYRNSPAARKQ